MVSSKQLLAWHAGGSEASLRKLFAEAVQLAQTQPLLLYIKSVEQLGPRRSSADAHGSRLCTQLLTLLDGAFRQKGMAPICPQLHEAISVL